MLARHASDLIGPSSGTFYKLYVQIWYVVIRVLLDTSSRYQVTAGGSGGNGGNSSSSGGGGGGGGASSSSS
jgi:uncharacterized membrane protein YgcG